MTSLVTLAPVQVAEYAPGAAFGPRQLLEFEFVWLLRGSVRWTLYGAGGAPTSSHTLTPGRLTLSRRGSIDSYHWDEHQATTHAYVHFELAPADWPGDEVPEVRELSEVPLMAAICDYLVELGGLPGDVARARSDRLVSTLLDLYVGGRLADPVAGLPPSLLAVLGEVRRIWRRDGLRIVSADELAVASRVSPGHLFRLFREHLGHGPAQVLELTRLSRAASTLQRTNATLGEVAHQCGFANPYHLSRRFSAAYGVPPGRFRRIQEADPLAPLRTAGLLPVAYALADR